VCGYKADTSVLEKVVHIITTQLYILKLKIFIIIIIIIIIIIRFYPSTNHPIFHVTDSICMFAANKSSLICLV
jgi:hypothetical protein